MATTIHQTELEYMISSVDAANALVTWSYFYTDCAVKRFSIDGIRASIRFHYPQLNKEIAIERGLKPHEMQLPTEKWFDVTTQIIFDHYQEERESL